ncbi:mechanosensitive ion channel family protein [Aureimonas leprariae]|uniref:Mechanosensitive ion channel n=1 Tax=Plantimonas leprariae TaxID=2615207 RepID=A0A7V7PPD1_9HYPH|nr:mechanosensitive ion channel domain-containing protein [Aureimonas leprariae]KAB0679824.1 mechanosensitive ion channel [Aureimonas leprariae]
MVSRASIVGFLIVLCLSIVPASAQIPGLPKLVGSETQPADATKPGEPADRQADVQALDRIIQLFKDDKQRTDFVGSLEQMRAGLVMQGPPAPEQNSALPAEGLIGALATNVGKAVDEFPTTALGDPPHIKLANAMTELQDRAATNFGGEETLGFLSWALPGVGVVAGVMLFLSRNRWIRSRRTILRRKSQTRLQLLRRVSLKLLFDLLPWFGGVVAIALWTTAFSHSWRDTQLFLGLTTPFVLPALIRQLFGFGLLLLVRSRGWKLVNYARLKLLPWIGILTSAGVAAGLMREFAVRLVIGRNVADVASLALDLLTAGLTVLFVMRHRRTVRSLIVKGRQRRAEGDHGTGVLATVITAFANFWHVFAMLFVVANVGARLFGIGGDNFFEDALFAVMFILAGLFFLAFANETVSRWREQLGRGRSTARNALGRRYLGLFHIVLQIATTIVVAIACIDLWGFQVAEWLTTASGSQVLRPAISILLVPLVVWLIWITVDTLIEHALAPVDNFGRQRQQSARIKTLLPLLRNFVFAALSVITVIAVLANIGVNVAPLLAGAGIIGIAISFGSQQLVQDVITGFFFLFEDALAIGDTISTGTQAGVVEGINIRTVKIRAGDGALYSVPFSQIKALQNSSRGYGIFQVAVTIGFESDADQAMDIMREIGAELRSDPKFKYDMLAPIEIWGVDGFSADGTVLKGAIRCRPLQQWGVGREFNRRLKRRFDEDGIVLFRPKQVIEIAGNRQEPMPEENELPPPRQRAANGAMPRPA